MEYYIAAKKQLIADLDQILHSEYEIYFFRKIKPEIHAYLIFFSILAEIETAKYHKSDEELKNHIDKKFRMFRHLHGESLDFVTYYMEGLTHLDRIYFLRQTDILKITRHSTTRMIDPEFTTTYDLVAADIIAHQMLKKYYFPDKEESKTVNYGDVEIIELCQALQSIFRIHMDDPYRIFTDLANRKTAQVKFIPKMEEGFLSKVDEMNTKK